MIRISLELIRIIIIFLIAGSITGALLKLLYAGMGINLDNTNGGWLAGIAILLIFFVLYRNKLQFSGFNKGEEKIKLSKNVTITLISFSVLLLIGAPLFL